MIPLSEKWLYTERSDAIKVFNVGWKDHVDSWQRKLPLGNVTESVIEELKIAEKLEKSELSSIEVGPTVLAWPMTLTLTYDLDLQSCGSYAMTYLRAKAQG